MICGSCGDQGRYALTRIPDLVVHIRSQVVPSLTQIRDDSGSKRTKADAAPVPLNLAAVADADDLHALVAELVERVIDERGLAGPSWSGSDVRPSAKRRTAWDDVVYVQPRVAGLKDATATAGLVSWLLPHLDWLWGQPDAGEAVGGLCRAERGLSLRWPIAEAPRYLPAPCPACDRLTLSRYAPQAVCAPVTVVCVAPDCRYLAPDGEFERLTLVLASASTRRRTA